MAWTTQTYTATVVKLIESPGWNAGARTIAELANNGGFTFTVGQSIGIVCGFNQYDTSVHYRDVQHGFLIESTSFKIIENGLFKSSAITFTPGSIFKIERIFGQVEYFCDDTLIYTSLIPSIGTVFLDSALYMYNDSILDVTLFATEAWQAHIENVSLSALLAQGHVSNEDQLNGTLSPLTVAAETVDLNAITISLSPLIAVSTDDDLNRLESTLSPLSAFGEDTLTYIPEYNLITIELSALQVSGVESYTEPVVLEGELLPISALGVDDDIQFLWGALSPLTTEMYLSELNTFVVEWSPSVVLILAPTKYLRRVFITRYQQRREKLFTSTYSLGSETSSIFETQFNLLDYDIFQFIFESRYRDVIQSINQTYYSDHPIINNFFTILYEDTLLPKVLFTSTYSDQPTFHSLLSVNYKDSSLTQQNFSFDYTDTEFFQSVLLQEYADTEFFQSVLLQEYADTEFFQSVLLQEYADTETFYSILSTEYHEYTPTSRLFTITYTDNSSNQALIEFQFEGVDLAPVFEFNYSMLDSCEQLFLTGYSSEQDLLRSQFSCNFLMLDEPVTLLNGSCWIEFNE